MPEILIVAATERELSGRAGIACGVGPVEAAAATARALALHDWSVLLHVGVAGGRGFAAGTVVIGAEARYCDLAAAIPVVGHVRPDPRLLEAARRALPDAPVLPIGTSAAVGGAGHGVAVEAMEGFGVLRAAELAGVPALEVRAIGNEIDEPDRSRWSLDVALTELGRALPALVESIGASLRGA